MFHTVGPGPRFLDWRVLAACAVAGTLFVALMPGANSPLAGNEIVKKFSIDVALSVDGHHGIGHGVWELHMATAPTRSAQFLYYDTRVVGEAVQIALDDGRIALMLRRSAQDASNIGYGDLIVDCLTELDPLKRPAALAGFEGGCDASRRRPLIVVVPSTSDSQSIVRASYPERASSPPVVDSLQITVGTTDEAISTGIADRLPWILKLPSVRVPGGYEARGDKYYREDFITEIAG